MPYDTLVERRDYSLTGPSAAQAIERGLASAEWYHSEVPRKVMKELMQRRRMVCNSSGSYRQYFFPIRQKEEVNKRSCEQHSDITKWYDG